MRRFAFLLAFSAAASFAQDLRFASLGDFRLDSGEVIRDCRIGYRTYGTPGARAIVVTTWFGGTTAGLASSIGPGKLFDSSTYYVIAIDALGDGISSSPSNSTTQPNETFPHFTIRDMVRSQYEVLTRELHIDHVYAVSGLSMGGIQTFQWVASYPDFMDKAIPIAGTPRQTSYDLVLWKTELEVLESGAAKPMDIIANINSMHLNTPPYIVEHTQPDAVDGLMRSREASLHALNRYDYESQLRAMIAHDIGTPPPTKAKMLVIVALQDQMVNPTPAREFARTHAAELVTLSGDCGHLATACEAETVRREVARFLAR